MNDKAKQTPDEAMQDYTKIPVTIQAAQWLKHGDLFRVVEPYENFNDEWMCGACGGRDDIHGWVRTLEGGHIVCPKDWIICGVAGEYYPCKPNIFEQTYSVGSPRPASDVPTIKQVAQGEIDAPADYFELREREWRHYQKTFIPHPTLGNEMDFEKGFDAGYAAFRQSAELAAMQAERDKWKSARDECERQFQSKVDEIIRMDAERDELREQDENNGAEIMRLKMAYDAEVGRSMLYQTALEHYADKDSWFCQVCGSRCGKSNHYVSVVKLPDGGNGYDIARTALGGTEAKK